MILVNPVGADLLISDDFVSNPIIEKTLNDKKNITQCISLQFLIVIQGTLFTLFSSLLIPSFIFKDIFPPFSYPPLPSFSECH